MKYFDDGTHLHSPGFSHPPCSLLQPGRQIAARERKGKCEIADIQEQEREQERGLPPHDTSTRITCKPSTKFPSIVVHMLLRDSNMVALATGAAATPPTELNVSPLPLVWMLLPLRGLVVPQSSGGKRRKHSTPPISRFPFIAALVCVAQEVEITPTWVHQKSVEIGAPLAEPRSLW